MRAEAPRHDGRADVQARAEGPARNEGRTENREPREPRAEGARSERPRRERGDRAERGDRIPRDAVEQDLALANQAAMAAAMRGDGAEPAQDRPAQDAGRSEGRRERGDRNGRRNDRRGERTEGENTGAERDGAFNPEATPSTAGTTPVAMSAADGHTSAATPVGEPGEEQRQPRERRSRDRYGRDRRERGEQPERNEAGPASEPASEASAAPVYSESKQAPSQQEAAHVATEYVAPVPVAQAIEAAPARVIPTPVRVTELVAATPKPVALTAAVAAVPATGALPKVQSYDLPLQDLAQVAQASGLQWVNSNAGKIAEVTAAMALEVKPVHVPRERASTAVSTEGPLVLVETKRDMGTMRLPFEGPAG